MYFVHVSSNTVIDLERVWCYYKKETVDENSKYKYNTTVYCIEFILSDDITITVNFDHEEERDAIFENINKTVEKLNIYRQ